MGRAASRYTWERQCVSYEFFASYSFNFRLFPILIFPYFYGAGTPFLNVNTWYFGPTSLTEVAGYIGIMPLFFAGMSVLMFWKKSWRIVFFAFAAVLAGLLVLGNSTPLYRFMYYVPIYNMFRAPARNWLEVHFAITVLCGYFIHYIIASDKEEFKRTIRAVFICLVLFWALVVFLLTYGYRLASSDQVKQMLYETNQLSSQTVYIPLVIFSVTTIALLLLSKFRQNRVYWFSVAVIVFVDLFTFGGFYDTYYPSFLIFQNKQNPVADYLSKVNPDKDLYRILSLSPHQVNNESHLYPLINILYGFNASNGYGAIWLKDFRDLTQMSANGISSMQDMLIRNSRILSLLSTKYLLVSNKQEKDALETFLIDNPTTKIEEVIISDFPKANVVTEYAELTKSTARLRSTSDGGYSLIQIPFEIKPNTNYQVSFSAKASASLDPEDFLIVDFYGDGYDNPSQESQFNRGLLSEDFREYTILLNTGSNTPQNAFLRFFTFSGKGYEVKDIQMVETSGGARYWGSEKIDLPSPLYVKRYESPDGVAVYENLNFLPRSRFVQEVLEVKDTNEAVAILWIDSELDPSLTALVENYSGSKTFDPGEVLSSDYSKNDRVKLKVITGERSFLVLSDSYYVGWKAFVDGKETPIYKTNGSSRGIIIEEAGEHTVEFVFVPVSFYIGLILSGITLLIIFSILIIEMRSGSY